MRKFISSRFVQTICYTLVLALFALILPERAATPAHAQLVPDYSIGVVDFINESGVKGDLLSRLATDAVVVEIGKTNSYMVSVSRSQMQEYMKELKLRSPLSKVGLVRLGELIDVDAMLQGSIVKVKLSGSGAARRASVTLAVQLVDKASGETINGAVQTGVSSSRVGYQVDDDELITEALEDAAYLAVKTMADYTIPEATIMMNVGDRQVMLNKGARNGIDPGMRMIVLRNTTGTEEIIGYLDVHKVDPTDAIAKVTKTFKGIQPQDKVRAIYEMPTLSAKEPGETFPSGAPPAKKGTNNTLGKIGQFIVAAAVIFGLFSLFKPGRANESGPDIGPGLGDTSTVITWNIPSSIEPQNVLEVQILRDDFAQTAVPYFTISDPSLIDKGRVDLYFLYGTGAATTINYRSIPSNPWDSTSPPATQTATIAAEAYGTTHKYEVRLLYQAKAGISGGDDDEVRYQYTDISPQIITATAIEKVMATDSNIQPLDGEEVAISELLNGDITFTWPGKLGANQYQVEVQPVNPVSGPTWTSSIQYFAGTGVVEMQASDRIALANTLSNFGVAADTLMKWRVKARNSADTSTNWYVGDWITFKVGASP